MDYKIEALDTSILVRLVAKDDPEFIEKVPKFFERPGKRYRIDSQAISELVYVMQTQYEFSRENIADHLDPFLFDPLFVVERDILKKVVAIFLTHPKLSFNDCYLAVKAETEKHLPLWTLDHKLALQCENARELVF